MLARQIPLFPLPNVVLFPNVFLPLHIFEPRYRRMVADALAGDRMIGIVLLKPGWEPDYEGTPAVYPVGCTGLITHAEPLEDGRYNIVLRGLEKFRILEEDSHAIYRRARVEVLIEDVAAEDRESVHGQRQRLEALLAPSVEAGASIERMEQAIPTAMPDEDLIHALAQYLALEPMERQALLERESVRARGESLIELLEMKELAAPHAWKRPKPS
jgi:Lon protease-like protein